MHKILLTDRGLTWDQALDHFDTAAEWAQDHCPSFRSHETQDISDFSMISDLQSWYEFGDAEDAIMFRLRWSGS